jgi:chaperonin GroES
MSKLRPLGDRIIIKRTVNPDTITPGGIVIPDAAREKPQEGDVVAVGRGRRVEHTRHEPGYEITEYDYEPPDVQVGDRVLFGKFAGSEINIDGEPHIIMREEEILGVIELGKGASR